jgi:hypothetical protein
MPDAASVLDAGNTFLAKLPCDLVASVIDLPDGKQAMALTIHTPSGTTTVFLEKEDASSWGRAITETAKTMSAFGLVVAGAAAMPNGNGKRP